jgi:hypothetical protein
VDTVHSLTGLYFTEETDAGLLLFNIPMPACSAKQEGQEGRKEIKAPRAESPERVSAAQPASSPASNE